MGQENDVPLADSDKTPNLEAAEAAVNAGYSEGDSNSLKDVEANDPTRGDKQHTALQGPETKSNKGVLFSVLSSSYNPDSFHPLQIPSLPVTLASLSSTLVATMLPTISRDLNGESNYSWAPPLLLHGAPSQTFLAVKTSSSSPSSNFSSSPPVLQGIGGGALLSMAFVVIGEIVPQSEMGKYMGLMGAMSGFSAAPWASHRGLLNDYLNWRWGFYICLPVGTVALVGCLFGLTLPPPRGTLRDQIKRVDYIGLTLLTIAITLLLLALSWGGRTYSWASGPVLGCIAAAFVLLGVFLWWETKATEPIIPLVLFKSRDYVAANIALFFSGWATYALAYFIPVYFQTVRGMSATDSGLNKMSMTAAMIVFSICSGLCTNKTGYYHFIPATGLAILVVGLGLCSMWDENSGKPVEIFSQMLAGAGIGLIINSGQLTAQSIHRPNTVANFFRLLGGVMGIGVFSILFSNILSSQLADGLTNNAVQYQLTADQIGVFVAYLQSAYSSTPVDVSSIPVDALASLNAAYIHANVQGLHWTFIVCVPIVGLGIIFAVFIRHKALKKTAALDMVNSEMDVRDSIESDRK
ncbi:hypothetical protein HDU93_004907 [Gonapodya sp. JEL0774]|nr:hypothetical protein HDU93_004907 [Gonapodya sp. JEL0774]